MDEDISEWAIDRALSRFSRPSYVDGTSWKERVMQPPFSAPFVQAVRFLATHIEKHEDPPVDPLAEIVREEFDYLVTLDDSDLLPIVEALRARGVTLKEGDA